MKYHLNKVNDIYLEQDMTISSYIHWPSNKTILQHVHKYVVPYLED